jgi:hypothetical protein
MRNEVVNRKFKLFSAMCIPAHVHRASDILRKPLGLPTYNLVPHVLGRYLRSLRVLRC